MNIIKLILLTFLINLTIYVYGYNPLPLSITKTQTFSSSNPTNIAFKSMTLRIDGKSKQIGNQGKLIFETQRLIISFDGHKEWFKILSVKKNNESLVFDTFNSQNEKAVFKIYFYAKEVNKVIGEMFGGVVDFQLSPETISINEISNLYSGFVSIEKPGKYIETKRDDGIISKTFEPQILLDIGGMQTALSYMTSQAGNYIVVVLRFENRIRMLDGILALRLSNNELLRFNPEKIQITNFGQKDGVLGIYKCPSETAKKLMKYKITNVSLSFKDGALSTYNVESNGDVLIKQIKLLQE